MTTNKMALDALTAIQDAIGMATSGDSSDFVWPKSTMRHPGETAYGWICEKHGLGYQSGCICCAGDLMAYREQKDREARYTREDAIREASKKVRAAIAALQAEPQGWRPIETAPKDGTPILARNDEYGARETAMQFYGEGSIGYADWKAGKGPLECGWRWSEPKNNWAFSWRPTHWMPLPATPPKD